MRTKRITCLFVSCLITVAILTSGASASTLIHGMRFPELSPDGSTLVFSYQGDLWKVNSAGGMASRLTASDAYESRARFSPDGTRLAFGSSRYGSGDVFVMDTDGAREPERVTFSTNHELLEGWLPDGSKILTITQAQLDHFNIFTHDLTGGVPVPLFEDMHQHSYPAITSDGNTVYYLRAAGWVDWWRTGYRGSVDADIWSYNVKTGEHKRIYNDDRNQEYLRLGHDESYLIFVDFVDQGSSNLAKFDFKTGKLTYLTDYKDDTVRRPSIDKKGAIVFEYMNDLFRMEPNGKPVQLAIYASAEDKTNTKELETLSSGVELASVSPDNSLVAMSVQGDIYAYRTDGEVDYKGVTLTNTSDALETEPIFSEDGKTVFYFKNEGYGNGIMKFDILTMTESLVLRADEGMHNLFRIPQTNLLSYIRGSGDVMVLNPDDGKQEKIAKQVCFECGRDYPMNWSPDGKYLVLVDVSQYDAEIILVNRETKETWNISHFYNWNWAPVFSPDGRYLAFTEEENDLAVVKLIELDPKTKLDKTVLVEEEEKPAEETPKTDEKVDAEKPAEETATDEAATTETKTEETPPAEEEKKIEVKINFDNITERARVVSISSGANLPMGFTHDGEFLFYINYDSYEMWIVPTAIDSEEPPKNLGPSPDALIYTGDAIYAISQAKVFKYSKDGMGDELKFVVQKNIDQNQEIILAFLLLGRNLKESFYDEKMHGANWDKAIQKYLGMISDARVPEDVAAIMNRLNGELNASHLGAYGPVSESGQPDETAQLGVEWDPFYSGDGLKVRRVYKNGPADKSDIEIKPGDIVLEIEGTKVDMMHDPSVVLNHKADNVLTLTVKGDTENRKVKIRAVEYKMLGEMKYETWVEENRQRVDKLSDNKLGYVHIQEMSGPALDKFRREYLNLTREKKGVIIDVRYNPGGFIHEQLIDTLDRKSFGFAQPRGLQNPIPQPYTYNRTPSVVLINEACTSDAEIFPYAYQQLGLGKLIGMETYGCVIGVVPAMLPGGYMMGLPCVGWYRLDTSNLENKGVKPDIEVDNPPDSIAKNHDAQLERAVEELLKEVR